MKKGIFIAAAGTMGSVAAKFLGGWDIPIQTLIIFMAVDYLTGITVAGVFHKSGKSKDGTLESRVGFKGLFRKGVILCMVLMANRLDIAFGTEIIRNTVIMGYTCNEALSIVENAGLMGVPIPQAILNSIEVLKNNGENNKNAFR